MSQNPNQFSQSVVKGLADLRLNSSVIPCRVAGDESTALVPGQLVKIADVAGGALVVTAVASDEDSVFGAVIYNVKDVNFPAGSAIEIAADNSVVYLEASAAIARGAQVMPIVTGAKVATATVGDHAIIGIAIDKAAADGDLVRVLLGKVFHFTASE